MGKRIGRMIGYALAVPLAGLVARAAWEAFAWGWGLWP
jgi:hypothetical protein